jgi:hypothetical protein
MKGRSKAMSGIRLKRAAAIAMAAGLIATARGDGEIKTPAKHDLRGGGSVELLGVSPGPSGPWTWWGPDGRPLDQPPYDRSGGSTQGDDTRKVRVFAIRVSIKEDDRVCSSCGITLG